MIRVWEEFAEQNGAFRVNPDAERVSLLAKGVFSNMRRKGLGYCPCRMTTGDVEEDFRIVCPCAFQLQQTWREKGECWCGLFQKVKP